MAGAAYWVSDASADYVRIPGSTDILVDVVSGPSARVYHFAGT